jgi:PAS domain S-box-containing protein
MVQPRRIAVIRAAEGGTGSRCCDAVAHCDLMAEVVEAQRHDFLEGANLAVLLERERMLATITDAIPVLVAYVDAAGRYQFVSAEYERWFGHAKAHFVGKHMREVLGEAAYGALQPHVENALAGSVTRFELEVPYRDAGTRRVSATYIPQRDPAGEVTGFVSLVADITERRAFVEREQRLLKITSALASAVTADEVFEALVDQVGAAVDATTVALWIASDDGRTLRLARALGYEPETVRLLAQVPVDSSPSIPALDAFRSGEPLWIATQQELLAGYPHLASVVRPGGRYRVACLPLGSARGPHGVLGISSEVAAASTDDERGFLLLVARYASQALERVRLDRENVAARARAEQLTRFATRCVSADSVEQVFDAALDAIERALGTDRAAVLLFDGDGVMRFRAWRKLSDDYRRAVEGHSPWPRDAIAPQPVLVPDVAADASLATYRPLLARERIGSLAFIPLVTHGRLLGKFMVYYAAPHAYSTTDLELATAIANHLASVTSRFSAVAQLERTVHDNELFAGVLAHDLRNPLGAIMTAAQLLLMRPEGTGERTAKPLARIMSSGQRMTRMIDQLLDFTRARVGGGIAIQPRDSNLADLCNQAVSELELIYPDRNIECSFVGDLGGRWDPDRVLQIVSNLVANAGQHGTAMAGVHISVEGVHPDTVVLEVHNDGAIAPALLPNLFDPFRGTQHRREQSRGLGLGLYIVKELARAHGGTVEVVSSAAEGTTFTVRLPRHAPGKL